MERENDHGRLFKVDCGKDVAQGVIEGAVDVEQRACGDARFACGIVGPKYMTAAMGFAEDGNKEIPWARGHQPSRQLAFSPHAFHEIFADAHSFTERFFDRDLDTHWMRAESPQDLGAEFAR